MNNYSSIYPVEVMDKIEPTSYHHPIDERSASRLAEIFRSLSDPSRIRIVSVLAEGETSVGALAQAVGDKGKVYGIDISEGMCNISLSRMEKSGLSERVELHCGDATQLPFKANCFDAVFISFALELFDTPEIPAVLNECHRVLKDDGRICIVAMSKKAKDGMMVKLYEWFHDRLPNYVDCRPIYVRDALEQAGFRVQDVSKMYMWGLPVEIVLARK